MNHEEYQEAARYWEMKDKDNVRIDNEKLHKEMEAYILANNTCALATGSDDMVRCTPIEYSYMDGAFYLFSEGGLKFAALEKNKKVCMAIFDKYQGFGKLKGMQVTGVAEIVEPFSDTYVKAAELKKIPIAALKKLPHTMNLLKVVPKRIDMLNSDFKEQGCASRQALTFE